MEAENIMLLIAAKIGSKKTLLKNLRDCIDEYERNSSQEVFDKILTTCTTIMLKETIEERGLQEVMKMIESNESMNNLFKTNPQ